MFAENLKKARIKAKMSQEKVAEVIQTSRSNISKYENGKLEPNLQTLKLLCIIYNVSADEILGLDKKINVETKNSIINKQIGGKNNKIEIINYNGKD